MIQNLTKSISCKFWELMLLEEKQHLLYFIIGIGRSGTSLLQEIMNTFEEFCNNTESRIYKENKFTSLWTPIRKEGNFKHLENFIKKNWTSKYFVEKTPDSILCLPQLKNKYPNANYIFLERNPRDIVLSQLNQSLIQSDVLEREYHIRNLIMDEEDIVLNREQYFAKSTLKQVYCQILNKQKFKKSFTIKYESLTKSLHSILLSTEKKFGIKPNYGEALNLLKQQSYSSKNNKYEFKNLKDKQAISMVKTACRLWNYDTKFDK